MQGAVFDMDGVLLDSMPFWENSDTLYLGKFGKVPREDLKEILFTKSMVDSAEYIREAYEIDRSVPEIVEGIVEVMRQAYESQIPGKPGVVCFLQRLAEQGIGIAVATASDRLLAQAGLERNGLARYIREIVTCEEAGANKERPDVFLMAAEAIGSPVEHTWVFEDSLHGIITAKKAGFHTVGIYDEASKGMTGRIRETADLYLEDLTDFDGFFQVARRMQP